MTYHNTTNQSGSTLKEYTEKAKSQDEIILELYKKHKRLSPSRVFVLMQGIAPAPITSFRRAISNLTKDGKLVKTNETVLGIYKRPEYVWEIKAAVEQGKLF
jgi:hypothetical protein